MSSISSSNTNNSPFNTHSNVSYSNTDQSYSFSDTIIGSAGELKSHCDGRRPYTNSHNNGDKPYIDPNDNGDKPCINPRDNEAIDNGAKPNNCHDENNNTIPRNAIINTPHIGNQSFNNKRRRRTIAVNKNHIQIMINKLKDEIHVNKINLNSLALLYD